MSVKTRQFVIEIRSTICMLIQVMCTYMNLIEVDNKNVNVKNCINNNYLFESDNWQAYIINNIKIYTECQNYEPHQYNIVVRRSKDSQQNFTVKIKFLQFIMNKPKIIITRLPNIIPISKVFIYIHLIQPHNIYNKLFIPYKSY